MIERKGNKCTCGYKNWTLLTPCIQSKTRASFRKALHYEERHPTSHYTIVNATDFSFQYLLNSLDKYELFARIADLLQPHPPLSNRRRYRYTSTNRRALVLPVIQAQSSVESLYEDKVQRKNLTWYKKSNHNVEINTPISL